ncbi:PiggyBac transposable element-derived protein 4 [Labeo rohita]|uniref:PiggyBac transposable element-derived protein 4 n=1 Tax=Labeo rohita TaxID=84645 RepID=A0ABQ8L2B5_LABRO|nr:PiggyBac transposable element-derived protein 4 [Labeo rohita]
MFLMEDVVREIVEETNRYASEQEEETKGKMVKWAPTSIPEMYTFLASVLLIGMDRFLILLRCLHFANNTTEMFNDPTAKSSTGNWYTMINLMRGLLEEYSTSQCPPKGGRPALDTPLHLTARHCPSEVPQTTSQGSRTRRHCKVCLSSTRKSKQRRFTKYMCVPCNTPLCAVPCFEDYHNEHHLDLDLREIITISKRQWRKMIQLMIQMIQDQEHPWLSKQVKVESVFPVKHVSPVTVKKAILRYIIQRLHPFSTYTAAWQLSLQRPTLLSKIAEATLIIKQKATAAMNEVEWIVATGSHTFEVLASAINYFHLEYEICDKVVCTPTDSGSNFLKACRVFGAENNDIETEAVMREVMVWNSKMPLYSWTKMMASNSSYQNIKRIDAQKALSDEHYKKFYRSLASAKFNGIKSSLKQKQKEGVRFNPAEMLFLTEWANTTCPPAKVLNILQAETNKQLG